MNETIIETQDTGAPETGLLRRAAAGPVTAGDGRTVDVKIVPYGESIEHNDGLGGVPKGVMYREEWGAGAFDHQMSAPNRVLANCEHEEGIRGIIGHGIALMERADGLYGSFRIHDSAAGDTALTLIREGVFDKVSLEARPRRSVRTTEGVIRRVKADLVGLAFSRFGAYSSARVLALREEAETVLDEAFLPVDIDPELLARCRALDIELPQRYQAHPDDTDTSAEADTSEAGTRPSNTDNTKDE
jgi:uncharacterized protein